MLLAASLAFAPADSAEPGRLVTPCQTGQFDTATILAKLPEQARGELVWFAQHNQVIIVEADIGFGAPPFLVVSRRDGNYFITAIRSNGSKQRLRSAPLPATLAGEIAAGFRRPMDETHEYLGDGATGWEIEFVNGPCHFVRQDFFQRYANHWTVSLLWGLSDLAESRSKRAARRAEGEIADALRETPAVPD